MDNRSVLDATTEIVVALINQNSIAIDANFAKFVAEFAEVIYEKFYELDNKAR